MAVDLLTYANREKVARALTDRGYSVSRNTVNRWARGDEMPNIAAKMIVGLFGVETEPAAPEVPERLERIEMLLRAIASVAGVDLDRVERMHAELLAARPQQQHGAAHRTRSGTIPADE